jgi:hypothetical protein
MGEGVDARRGEMQRRSPKAHRLITWTYCHTQPEFMLAFDDSCIVDHTIHADAEQEQPEIICGGGAGRLCG